MALGVSDRPLAGPTDHQNSRWRRCAQQSLTLDFDRWAGCGRDARGRAGESRPDRSGYCRHRYGNDYSLIEIIEASGDQAIIPPRRDQTIQHKID